MRSPLKFSLSCRFGKSFGARFSIEQVAILSLLISVARVVVSEFMVEIYNLQFALAPLYMCWRLFMSEARNAKKELRKLASKKKAKQAARYFKTGIGEYGEGDIFIGVTVPQIRAVAKQFKHLCLSKAISILKSKIHEERLMALEILQMQYEKAEIKDQNRIYSAYLKNKKHINNWDLVDGSAPGIVGKHLVSRDKRILYKLAKSKNLWDRRIAMLSTFTFIRDRDFKVALELAKILIDDSEDLMHKAVGWMLREIGNRDLQTEERFLKFNYKKMPRTMLRYAIEKFPEAKRKAYLKNLI